MGGAGTLTGKVSLLGLCGRVHVAHYVRTDLRLNSDGTRVFEVSGF